MRNSISSLLERPNDNGGNDRLEKWPQHRPCNHPPLHYWIAHAFMPPLGDGRALWVPFAHRGRHFVLSPLRSRVLLGQTL
jgi:hypothetical protein